MSLIACPGCSLPRTDADSASACPVCGYESSPAVAAPLPLVLVPTPIAVTRSVPASRPLAPISESTSPPVLPWILAGLGFGSTLVCAAGWYLATLEKPQSVEPVSLPPVVLATPQPSVKKPSQPEPREVAPLPRLMAELKASPWEVSRPAADERPAEVIRVDEHVSDFRLEAVAGRKRIKLVGVANKLYLASVTEGASVDASELKTSWVMVTGRIGDGATVRVAAINGPVVFSGPIASGARVTVESATSITVGRKGVGKGNPAAQPEICEGAQLNLTGKSVSILSTITGPTTVVTVTLQGKGPLRFGELDGGAKLLYRTAEKDDPPPIIHAGPVKGQAEFKRVE